MQDLKTWLKDLGLEKYAGVFERDEIDLDVLATLREADLETIGLPLGPRRKLLGAIAAMARDSGPRATTVARDEAQRRQLTVMFSDIVGWTTLSGTMDPEELREVMRAYQNLCAQAIRRYDGFLAQFLGDGVLAYFGYPRAHEDDAERAVRAGRDILARLEQLGQPGGQPMRIRVGIASGLVVVGDLVGDTTSEKNAVVGETPNLAARLQAFAGPGEVVIAYATQRLLRGVFDCTDLGFHVIKGIAEPVRICRVDGERTSPSRFDAATGKDSGSFVGRNSEIEMLSERWRVATGGDGQVVLLSGEAGIGKSRICAALRDRIASERHVSLFCQCSVHHTASPLYPVVRQIEFACGFAPGDDNAARLTKLVELLKLSGHDRAPDVVSLMADLLSIPTAGRFPAPEPSVVLRKARTMDALVSMLLGLAASTPVLFIVEDAHWIDPTTVDLIGRTIERLGKARVLMVVTHRPEYLPPWLGQTHVSSLALHRLSREICLQLIASECAGRVLPNEVVEQIIEKTDGVPLFVEELTKAVLESELLRDTGDRFELTRAPQAFAIPSTLHDALMARLDRLAPVRGIAQVGAAIGREFDYRLIARVLPIGDIQLRQGLLELEQAEMLHRRGEPPDATYMFKHALVQDVAYESLLKARRKTIHGEILAALESDAAERGTTQPELLAHHAAESGQIGKGIDYLQQAGEHALRRGANVEAIKHLRYALAAIATQPASADLKQSELSIQSRLGGANMSVYGWGAPDTQACFERAREIARETGNLPALVSPLIGLWIVHLSCGRIDRSMEVSQELFGVARALGDDGLLLQAHHSAWPLKWQQGNFAQAQEHVDQGVAIYDEVRHADHRILYLNHDPGVCARLFGASMEWMRGYPDAALEQEQHGLAMARRLLHLPTLTTALWQTSEIQILRRDFAAVLSSAQELLRLCAEARIVEHVPYASIIRAWALAQQGQIEDGRREMEAGLTLLRAQGRHARTSNLHALGAETSLLAGRYDEGLQRIAVALEIVEGIGERYTEVNIRVIRGHLLLHSTDDGAAKAQAEFARAIALARAQGALSYELHATVALARLLGDNGERLRAHAMLAPVYARFSEGFATPALRDAKTLLDALG